MLAAENGALPGGKVGGVGDVLRDLPPALAALGHEVTVLTPGYGRAELIDGARCLGAFAVDFGGAQEEMALFRVGAPAAGSGVTQLLLDHPQLAACGIGRVYCDDGPGRPFATDAGKFALFCAGAAQALAVGELALPDVVHLHDWHAAGFAVLARLDPRFRALATLPLVYSIHNLAMQGIRPLRGDPSSLAAWYPQLAPTPEMIDPRYGDCYNPVQAALVLSDEIHTVSPTYAEEICRPHAPEAEGMQPVLAAARDRGALHGILNGCDYDGAAAEALPWVELLEFARRELTRWIGEGPTVRSAHFLALRRLDAWLAGGSERPPRLLTMISRLTEQKAGILAEHQRDGRPALAHALDLLQEGERLLVLGNGQPELEQLFTRLMATDERLLFLCGFSEQLSEQLYAGGDLFLMPSRFEPCGIAQMMAMRAGQPCLVHRTGGLADTVEDGVTGFVFAAKGSAKPSAAMLARLKQALAQLRRHRRKREAMREAAAAARFLWQDAARQYVQQLYGGRS